MAVRIRRARRSDHDVLVSLADWPRSTERPRRSVRLFRNVVSDLSYDLYVAEESGEIVGLVAVSYTRVLRLGGHRAVLEDLIVRRDRRGSGLGRRLMEFVVARVAKRGARSLEVDVAGLEQEAFLEHLGFTPSGRWLHRSCPGGERNG